MTDESPLIESPYLQPDDTKFYIPKSIQKDDTLKIKLFETANVSPKREPNLRAPSDRGELIGDRVNKYLDKKEKDMLTIISI
jgi:hypothetical protein